MPKYSCYKEVWALKIKHVQRHKEGGATITPEEEGYAAFEVDWSYVTKHDPEIGGYYIVYKDGYKSWSPAEAFESGYRPIPTPIQRDTSGDGALTGVGILRIVDGVDNIWYVEYNSSTGKKEQTIVDTSNMDVEFLTSIQDTLCAFTVTSNSGLVSAKIIKK